MSSNNNGILTRFSSFLNIVFEKMARLILRVILARFSLRGDDLREINYENFLVCGRIFRH